MTNGSPRPGPSWEDFDMLRERLENIEELLHGSELRRLPAEVAKLSGTVATLTTLVTMRLNGVAEKQDRMSSWKTMMAFAATVIVPVIVALIGGYFVLRAGGTISK